MNIETEWRTPNGKARNVPMYSTTVANAYLRTSRTFRGSDRSSVKQRAAAQLKKWQQQERRQKDAAAKQDELERAAADAQALDEDARTAVALVSTLLESTLTVDDRIDWEELRDRHQPPPFEFAEPAPAPPDAAPRQIEVSYAHQPPRPWYSAFWPGAERRWQARCAEVDAANRQRHADAQLAHEQEIVRCEQLKQRHAASVHAWQQRREAALRVHEAERLDFVARQREHNSKVDRFKDAFEKGMPAAVTEYLRGVFERSDYPDCFPVKHFVEFEGPSRRTNVTMEVPSLSDFPSVTGYTFVPSKREAKPVSMKKNEQAKLYEQTLAQAVLRTLHEVFEADYVPVIYEAAVSVFVSYVDPATGNDRRECKVAASAERNSFLALDLKRLDPVRCVQTLSHAVIQST